MENIDTSKKKRLEMAISHLISIGMIDGENPTKSIAETMGRGYSGVSSAINGSKRYLTYKFLMSFCAKYGNIISLDWILDGKGMMVNTTKYNIQDSSDTKNTQTAETEVPRTRLLKLKEWLVENDPKCKHNESRVLRMMGLGVGYFSTTERQNNQKLHSNTYNKIHNAWPQVNLDWLRTGEGEMFNDTVTIEAVPASGVPYYDVDFLGGFNEIINDQTTIPAYFINCQPYNKKGNMWCDIVGDSMSPRINGGDKICIRRVEIEDIIYGEIYAIVTKNDMRTVKWVTRSPEKGMIRLIPENKDPRHGDYQDILKNDILFIYKVIGAIRSF